MTIQTKFNVGDNAWFMHENKTNCSVILKIALVVTNKDTQEVYTLERAGVDTFQRHVTYLHPTKEALLASL